jgi:hypothetical protein
VDIAFDFLHIFLLEMRRAKEKISADLKTLAENFGALQNLGGFENCCGKLLRLTKLRQIGKLLRKTSAPHKI